MKIAIGADHRGYVLKQHIQEQMKTITWHDCGTYNSERTDYPIYGHAVVEAMLDGTSKAGILLCGTGVGMSIVANRYCGIYAALAWNPEIARRAKEEDHANILVIPADYVTESDTIALIMAWFSAVPKKGRYEERVKSIDKV